MHLFLSKETLIPRADARVNKLLPYRQHTVCQQALYKLGSTFYEPCQMLERIGEVACKLELLANAHIHPVIHVSQLKLRIGSEIKVKARLLAVNQAGSEVIRPLLTLEYQKVKRA
ncbi:hypothetical protein ACS0TY_006311 [Phlomoides rotata]